MMFGYAIVVVVVKYAAGHRRRDTDDAVVGAGSMPGFRSLLIESVPRLIVNEEEVVTNAGPAQLNHRSKRHQESTAIGDIS